MFTYAMFTKVMSIASYLSALEQVRNRLGCRCVARANVGLEVE